MTIRFIPAAEYVARQTTRVQAYAVTSTGKQARYPFASFPHPDAARSWLASHPDERVRFVPALEGQA